MLLYFPPIVLTYFIFDHSIFQDFYSCEKLQLL